MYPMLGPANAALVSFYFASVWGREALKALISPYSGFEAPSHAAVSPGGFPPDTTVLPRRNGALHSSNDAASA